MATTTAAVTLTSDLLSDNMTVTTDTRCMKAGTTADGLDQMDMGYVEIAIGDQFDLLDSTVLSVNKANKLYVCNNSNPVIFSIFGCDIVDKLSISGSVCTE